MIRPSPSSLSSDANSSTTVRRSPETAMAGTFLLLLAITSIFVPSQAYLSPSDQESFVSVLISQTGLNFLKDVLVNEAVASSLPLRLSSLEKSVRIPVVGNVYMVLSNITIYEIDVSKSYVKTGDTGVAIIASGTTCNMSVNWYYSYSTWLLPIKVSDKGVASIQVFSYPLSGFMLNCAGMMPSRFYLLLNYL